MWGARAVSPPPVGWQWGGPRGASPPERRWFRPEREHVGRGGAREGAKNQLKKGNSGKTTTKAPRGEGAAGDGRGARRVPAAGEDRGGEKEKSNRESLWELGITKKRGILTQKWGLAGAQGQEKAEVCRGYYYFQGESCFKSSS